MIDAEYVRSILDYDPATGILRWKNRNDAPRNWNRRYAGTIAGTNSDGERIQIIIHKKVYRAHRLIWLMVHGTGPKCLIDHIDGNPLNNRLSNLREASHLQNCANRRPCRDHLKGAVLDKRTGHWYAIIRINRKSLRLGTFPSEQEAHDAYRVKAKELFGEYARFN